MTSFGDSVAALREPEFRKLFFGQATSVAGSMLTLVALPFAVLQIGGSATEIGVVEAAYILPMALAITAGGVWADRVERRRLMLSVDVVRMVLTLVTAVLLLGGVLTIPILLALQVGMGLCDAFFRPAYTGLVPQVVSAGRLQQANALQGVITNGAGTMGVALGGVLVAAMGPGYAIAINAGTFLVSVLFLWRLRPAAFEGRGTSLESAATTEGAGRSGFVADLRLGWQEFASHTWLWVMVAGASFFLMTVEAPLSVLGPIVARDHYDGARTWGFVMAGLGVGQIVGAVIALRWRPRRPFLILSAGMSVAALPMAMLAMTAPLWMLLLSGAAIGVVWGMYDPFWVTGMQREVAPQMLSRVSSYDYLGSLAFYPLGLALAGPLSDVIGIPATLWCGAACGAAVSVFGLSWHDVRAVHDLGAPPAPQAEVTAIEELVPLS